MTYDHMDIQNAFNKILMIIKLYKVLCKKNYKNWEFSKKGVCSIVMKYKKLNRMRQATFCQVKK